MPRTNDVIVVPLDHSSLPVAASSAYSTAGFDRWTRSATASCASVDRCSPVEIAKTTPLTMAGGAGDSMSRETQAGWRAGVPFWSTILNAAIAPLLTAPFVTGNAVSACSGPDAAKIQREPSALSAVASAPGEKSAAVEYTALFASGVW